MRELLRTNDLVLLSWAAATMRSAGIEPFVLDGHASVMEGSIGALQRRLMVAPGDYHRARLLLEEARNALGNP